MHHPTRRFAMSMAKEMGWPNVDAMLETITSSQLTEWIAFSDLEKADSDKPVKAQQVMDEARRKHLGNNG